jgi:hypothetical protein
VQLATWRMGVHAMHRGKINTDTIQVRGRTGHFDGLAYPIKAAKKQIIMPSALMMIMLAEALSGFKDTDMRFKHAHGKLHGMKGLQQVAYQSRGFQLR